MRHIEGEGEEDMEVVVVVERRHEILRSMVDLLLDPWKRVNKRLLLWKRAGIENRGSHGECAFINNFIVNKRLG